MVVNSAAGKNFSPTLILIDRFKTRATEARDVRQALSGYLYITSNYITVRMELALTDVENAGTIRI